MKKKMVPSGSNGKIGVKPLSQTIRGGVPIGEGRQKDGLREGRVASGNTDQITKDNGRKN